MKRNIHKAVTCFGPHHCVFDVNFTKYKLDDNIKYLKNMSPDPKYFHPEIIKKLRFIVQSVFLVFISRIWLSNPQAISESVIVLPIHWQDNLLTNLTITDL